MRTWTQILGAAALAFGLATMANAGTVDVVFTGSSGAGPCAGGTCTGGAGDIVTANVVLTTAVGDTTIGGPGGAYQISLDYSAVAGGPIAFTSTAPAGWFPAGAGVDNAAGFVQSAFNGVDLFGTSILGQPVSVTIGTITMTLSGAAGTVDPTLAGAGDAIVGTGGGVVNGEYTLNGGTIVPEPTTAALLGLGLGVLGIAGRRR